MLCTDYETMFGNGEFNGQVVDVNDILDILRGRYGDLDDECGCYINGEWISVQDVVRLIVDNAYVV